jgi:hypothetical protein
MLARLIVLHVEIVPAVKQREFVTETVPDKLQLWLTVAERPGSRFRHLP